MSVITMNQAIQYAQGAGFNGASATIIAAIAMAESSLNTDAQHTNSDGSIDRGILQINSYWHSEVPDSCAYDPVCAFKQAFRISNGGTSFTPWSTYNSGAYQQYMKGTSNPSVPQYTLATSANATNTNDWDSTLRVWGEAIAIFTMGAMLIFLGFYLMIPQQTKQAVTNTLGKSAEVAAIA